METDLIITLGIFFFCGAILTFWIKKRWKKAPEDELKAKFRDGPSSEDEVGGKWTGKEPEPPEQSREPEPEPRERPENPEPEPQKRDSRDFSGPENEPKWEK